MGRHANGDTPTGVLFVKPDDPKFRRAAGGRKTGKIPRIKPPSADTGFLPAQSAPSAPGAATAMIPAQRRVPEQAPPRVAVAVAVPSPRIPPQRGPVSAPPVQQRRPVPQVQMNMRLAPPPMRAPLQESEDESPRSLPTWTKICVVLGAVLILVGFGGLGAAYAVNQQADPTTAGTSELIQR
ncbi:hypothetical protein [Cryptosporangium sp. NPDC048952]|uniref:hypothetical protein n=1 Tax=Cryptosporangium sp. NPDC048952 TaxID=3363961 RepID=UPI0037226C39